MKNPEASGKAYSIKQLRMSCLFAAYRFEKEQAERGLTPDRERLADPRITRIFEVLTALILSALVAGMALLGSFLVFNVILHLDF